MIPLVVPALVERLVLVRVVLLDTIHSLPLRRPAVLLVHQDTIQIPQVEFVIKIIVSKHFNFNFFSNKGCHPSCIACTGSLNRQCTSCASGYYLQPSSTTCLSSCPSGYTGNPTTRQCILCDTACSMCTGTSYTECSACKSGYYLQPSSTICLSSCPSMGYFPNSGSNICDSNL